jgi:ArsR family transcriptional regulator
MGHRRSTGDGLGPRHGQPEVDTEVATSLAATFQALSAPSRLRLLAVLRDGSRTVGELVEAVGMEQSAVSHQLRLLREAGFVVSERQGRHIAYRLFDDHVTELLDQALFHTEHVRLGLLQSP